MSGCARGRLGRAVGLLAALLLAALALDAAMEAARPGVFGEALGMAAEALPGRSSATARAADAAACEGGGSAADESTAGSNESGPSVFDEAAGKGAPNALARLPDGFATEVLSLEGRSDVRVGAGGAVVGFSAREDPVRAFEAVSEELRQRGWTAVPSGVETGGSFAKREGPRTWAYVSCVRTGDTTSVVVQCAATEGSG